jgi:hypothetical protein
LPGRFFPDDHCLDLLAAFENVQDLDIRPTAAWAFPEKKSKRSVKESIQTFRSGFARRIEGPIHGIHAILRLGVKDFWADTKAIHGGFGSSGSDPLGDRALRVI